MRPADPALDREPAFQAGYLAGHLCRLIVTLEADPCAATARAVAARAREALTRLGLAGPSAEQAREAAQDAAVARMRRRGGRR